MKSKVLFLIVLFLQCCSKTDPPPKPAQHIEDGVIVWQEPLWRVSQDTANYVPCVYYPYCQFESKVIVETYKDGKGGLRCMEVESGEVLWEKYFYAAEDFTGDAILYLKYSIFPEEKGCLILPFYDEDGWKHISIDVDTGKTIWEKHLISYGPLEVGGEYYYFSSELSDDVFPIYRGNIETGDTEFFYATPLPPNPNFDSYRTGNPRPFTYNNKDYLFIDEHRLAAPGVVEFFISLMDLETLELLILSAPLDDWLSKVDVHNGEVYLFTGSGYKIFDMETLSVQKEVRLLSSGEYVYHTFYNDKLIVGLTGSDSQSTNGHFVINLPGHEQQFVIEDWVYPSSILNDMLYYVSTGRYFRAYNLNTGDKLLDINLRHKTEFGVATHQNGQGDKFVVVGDRGYTYCFEGI